MGHMHQAFTSTQRHRSFDSDSTGLQRAPTTGCWQEGTSSCKAMAFRKKYEPTVDRFGIVKADQWRLVA